MSRPVLIDSSWYIQKSRENEDVLRLLEPLARARELAVCGIIKAEVGRGLRDPGDLARFQRIWSVMNYIDDGFQRWEETLALVWSLDRKGIVIPVQDVHIAACALHAGAVILTYDQHFDLIPGVDATDRIY